MSASNYSACLKEILRNEGGYVNNPKDPGGETNYGITIATARANGYTGSMRTIPMSVVEAIYRKKFWKSAQGNCDDLPAGVDLVVFDYAVNSGPGRAWQFYKANKAATPADTISKLCAARLAFLRSLKTWPTFGKGWSTRVAHVRALAMKMAAAPQQEAPKAPPDVPKAEPKVTPAAPKKPTVTKPVVVGTGTTAVAAGFAHSLKVGLIIAAVVIGAAVVAFIISKVRK